MKKTLFTIAIVLGMTLVAFAQEGGLFGRGPERQDDYYSFNEGRTQEGFLNLPSSHGGANDQGAPLGSGVLMLIGLSAAYSLSKRRKQ